MKVYVCVQLSWDGVSGLYAEMGGNAGIVNYDDADYAVHFDDLQSAQALCDDMQVAFPNLKAQPICITVGRVPTVRQIKQAMERGDYPYCIWRD